MRAVLLTLVIAVGCLHAAPTELTLERARTATVRIDRLKAGAAPRLPWYDRTSRTIVDGTRRIKANVGDPGKVISLHVMSRGYLLRVKARGHDRLVLVRRNGHRQELNRRGEVYAVAVSPDGRWVGWSTSVARRTVAIVTNPASGSHRIKIAAGAHGFRLLALGAKSALVDDHGRARWWHWRTGALSRAASHRPVAVDLSSRRLAVLVPKESSRVQVFGAGTTYWLGLRETPETFSIDNRWLATNGVAPVSSLTPLRNRTWVRSADSGRVALTVVGKVAAGVAPRFESPSAVLVSVVEQAKGKVRVALVRCQYAGGRAGRCERAAPVIRVNGTAIPKPSWVLATPRSW